jgi:hypothetical protein
MRLSVEREACFPGTQHKVQYQPKSVYYACFVKAIPIRADPTARIAEPNTQHWKDMPELTVHSEIVNGVI